MEPAKRVRSPAKVASGPLSTVAIATPKRTALLVAGIVYPRGERREDSWNYRTYFNYCVKYKTYLLDKGLVDRVVIFDFLRGESLFYEKGGPPGGQLNFVYGPLRPKNFRYLDRRGALTLKRPTHFETRCYFTAVDDFARSTQGNPDADVVGAEYDAWCNGPAMGRTEKSLSIADVYEQFTRGLGANYCELHFFGHAHLAGPIMVNTYGNRPKSFDKDPRNDDFTKRPELDHVFGSSHLANSRASFGQDPIVCVWGCTKSRKALDLLGEIAAKDARASHTRASVPRFRTLVSNTYASHLARTMGFRVLGALPGMGSVHEGESNDDPVPYRFHPTAMHVSFSENEQHMGRYAKYLGTQFAKTGAFSGHPMFGRGYAYFDP